MEGSSRSEESKYPPLLVSRTQADERIELGLDCLGPRSEALRPRQRVAGVPVPPGHGPGFDLDLRVVLQARGGGGTCGGGKVGMGLEQIRLLRVLLLGGAVPADPLDGGEEAVGARAGARAGAGAGSDDVQLPPQVPGPDPTARLARCPGGAEIGTGGTTLGPGAAPGVGGGEGEPPGEGGCGCGRWQRQRQPRCPGHCCCCGCGRCLEQHHGQKDRRRGPPRHPKERDAQPADPSAIARSALPTRSICSYFMII